MSDTFVLADEFGNVVVVQPSDYNWDRYLLQQQQGGKLPSGAAEGTQEQMDALRTTIVTEVRQSYGKCSVAPGRSADDYNSLQVVSKRDFQME